jgi:hydrogenase maturation protein HypF
MSPHIGDMENLETFDAFHRTVGHLQKLFRLSPEVIACDLHPGYLSTQWAKDYAMQNKLPLVQVQHHHAHIAALLAEHRHTDTRAVIGVSFDGTGYGCDGAIWGGEFLMASYEKCERLAHLKYISLPGGDASVQRPYRTALAHLFGAQLEWDDRLPCVRACPKRERVLLEQQLAGKLNCSPTSSMGRMFDCVASLIGIRHEINYEGQAAMEMEARAQGVPLENDGHYQFALIENECIVVDPAPVIEEIIIQLRLGISPSIISARFHQSVAYLILQVCLRIRERTGTGTVALSGGVFQNVTLLEWTIELLERDKFDVLHHRQVPPNDGGLALGQAMIARHKP